MIDENSVIVDDDLLTISEQEEIKKLLTWEFFPWYLCTQKNSSVEKRIYDIFKKLSPNVFEYSQFLHVFAYEGEKNSDYLNKLEVIYKRACKKYNIEEKISRIKANFSTKLPNINKDYHQSPHIDINDLDHWVMIYYVNDSDGDTFIFNEKKAVDGSTDHIKSLTIKKRIAPKQGRLILFDGAHFHAGAFPGESDYRILINFVFLK